MIRTVIVATYPVARAGLAALIESDPEIEVVVSTSGIGELISLVESQAPDAIVLDVGDELDHWLDGLAGATHAGAIPPTLVLAGTPEVVSDAMRAGARGMLLRDASAEEMIEAVRAIARGLVVVDTRAAAVLTRPESRPADVPAQSGLPIEPLTSREREVLQLIARGFPNKAIAVDLGISEHTVKFHVGSILDKLGASSRSEAIARAARFGLIVL
jgi:DNA-binding NarL/FixJ family response regulator